MVGQIGVVGLHRGDHGVHGPSLERVHRRGPGPVDMAKLRIAALEIEHASVLKPVAHHAAAHFGLLCSLIVDEPEAGVDARPPDTVARSELHRLGPIHLDPARPRSQPSRFPGDRFAMLAGKFTTRGQRSTAATRSLSPFSTRPIIGLQFNTGRPGSYGSSHESTDVRNCTRHL